MHLTASVQRIAAMASDFDDARHRLDLLLRRAIGYDFAAFSTVDPASRLWTSCYVSGLGADGAAERERILYETELAGDLIAFDQLARRDVPVATLHATTEGHLERARRWAPLLEQYEVVDEARAVLRCDDQIWGSLVLYRAERAQPFSSVDLSLLATVVPSIAVLFRVMVTRLLLARPHVGSDAPGAFTVTSDGSLVGVTTAARDWLRALDDRGRTPAAVRSLAAAARSRNAPASVSLPCRRGGFVTLYGSRVEETDDVTVIIDAARPMMISDLMAKAYQLTTREREVAALAARGGSTRDMARTLQISPFTVGDHLKSLYKKVGVASRGELVAALNQRDTSAATSQQLGPAVYLDHNVSR